MMFHNESNYDYHHFTRKLQFIDSTRFMASSLSNLADNLAEGLHKINMIINTIIKNAKLVELITKIVIAVLNTQMLKMI